MHAYVICLVFLDFVIRGLGISVLPIWNKEWDVLVLFGLTQCHIELTLKPAAWRPG